MSKRLEFLALYWLCWLLMFQFFRVIFFIYHYKKALEIPSFLWVQSALYGFRMDLSFASYILIIPTLLMIFAAGKFNWYRRAMLIYSAIISFPIVLLVIGDLEIFRAWGFRIDGTSLHYLKTPAEAWASMGAAPVFPLLALFGVVLTAVIFLQKKIIQRSVNLFRPVRFWLTIPVFSLLAVSLIIPIRGGFQLAPMNESAVFFSDKSFANYAAVNVPWNYMSSLLNNTYSSKNPFVFTDQKEADRLIRNLYQNGSGDQQMVRPESKPNVIVIIWEGFTSKVAGNLGGLKNVTPEFEKLSKEGILFTNMYASGNRSDKGIVAILSGYPAQPTTSIIKIPKKTATLPSLPTELHHHGWHTSFYYGGETEFANMKSYFLQQSFDRIIDKNAFEKADMNSKWGAHDHIVLSRLLKDLDKEPEPFFSTLFTLSSHEPFEVPVKTAIPGSDYEHLFLNAHHYTDASISDFIKTAKTKPWWNNTLIIILADHGHPLPENVRTKPSEFAIPMLWLGGVVEKTNVRIDTLCSQTDLAATLLGQLRLPAGRFQWSNDIFMKHRQSFAYFAFNNGLGWVRPAGFLVRDNIGGNITERKGTLDEAELDLAKAYLQSSFEDYIRR